MQYILICHVHSAALVHLHLKCFDSFSDYKNVATARVSVLSVACGGGSASTAQDNWSYSTTTAVTVSSYFHSGSFHLWVGCLEDGVSLLNIIKLNVYLNSYVFAI